MCVCIVCVDHIITVVGFHCVFKFMLFYNSPSNTRDDIDAIHYRESLMEVMDQIED